MDKIGCIQGKMRLPFVISMQAATPYTVLFRWDVVSCQSDQGIDGAIRQQQRPHHKAMLKLPIPLQPHPSPHGSATMNNIIYKSESESPPTNKTVEQLDYAEAVRLKDPYMAAGAGGAKQILTKLQPISQSQSLSSPEHGQHEDSASAKSHETLNCEDCAALEAKSGESTKGRLQSGAKRTTIEQQQDISPLTQSEQSLAKRAKLSEPPYVQGLDWARQTLMAAFTPTNTHPVLEVATNAQPSSLNDDAFAGSDNASNGLDALAAACDNDSDSAFGVGNSVGQHSSGWMDQERANLLGRSSASSGDGKLTNVSSRRRVFESISDSANNPTTMMNRLAADPTLIFSPQDGLFPKPYSRPECEAAFQAQHVCLHHQCLLLCCLLMRWGADEEAHCRHYDCLAVRWHHGRAVSIAGNQEVRAWCSDCEFCPPH